MQVCEALGERLARVRTHRGLAQAELARRADVTASYINKVESGALASPGGPRLERIARALDVPVGYLLSGDDCPPSEEDLPPDLRARIAALPPAYRELIDELITKAVDLPDTAKNRARFAQAIDVVAAYLQSVSDRDPE